MKGVAAISVERGKNIPHSSGGMLQSYSSTIYLAGAGAVTAKEEFAQPVGQREQAKNAKKGEKAAARASGWQ